ncbi:uncharacterized protein ASPGLDRAFT_494653 [Aspergillus glaucus CBS 516.65]|uniref:Uncharacterized protein n=1 Tax=Aspergillus glaucus CBS 516.65 TaxID=1160497 RepID=A0A1L9VFP6_ASPGL|nr:hypothetical protein ASPGLDRAFT_494653 [Aspergillus glaucus CBS 516.65]OJJ82757.1 hypothetical protein ASPGLDRAFT_494653 [Aspergillus glaucus CBS 516.65]
MFKDFTFNPRPRVAFDGDDRLMVDSDSSLVSPLSSRCPSPGPFTSQPQGQRFPRSVRPSLLRSRQPSLPPTSVPADHQHGSLSIETLTKKLHEHTLQQQSQHQQNQQQLDPRNNAQEECLSPHSLPELVPGSGLPGYFLTPPDTDVDHDDDSSLHGDADNESTLTSPTVSHIQTPFLSPTSVPPEFLHTDSNNTHEAINVRAQRQQISQIQCSAADIEAIRRALICCAEEDSPMDTFGEYDCHPSSLPPRRSPRRRAVTTNRSRSRPVGASGSGSGSGSGVRAGVGDSEQGYRGRRKSSSGALLPSFSSRIDKNYYPPSSSREMRKKSEQGLRRKSLVSAALASMVENCL